MPLNRTPPPPNNSPVRLFKSPLEYFSDSNTSEMTEQESASNLAKSLGNKAKKDRLPKRKRGDIDDVSKADVMDMFNKLRAEQNAKFTTLMQSFNDIKSAMDFMSSKYDDVLGKMQALQEENKNLQNRLDVLELQTENLNRNARSACIEIRNIPQLPKETKDDLKNLICTSADTLNTSMEFGEVRDVYRINTKSSIKPIVVDFTTVGGRDRFLNAYKKYNKEHSSNGLGTASLNIQGTNRPIYISENLTQRDRRLFYLSRVFIKAYNYRYCWVSHGRIYIRKSEREPPIRIGSERDIEQLKNK